MESLSVLLCWNFPSEVIIWRSAFFLIELASLLNSSSASIFACVQTSPISFVAACRRLLFPLLHANFYSCHPPGVKKGFIKGEALRLLRTNSSQITFERNIRNFHNRLLERGYPAAILRKYLSEVKFADRKTALQQRNKSARKKLLPFVTQYHPALPSLKKILMGKWHLIQNQQWLREIFKERPLISYRKGKSLTDLLVRAKLWRSYYF